MLQDDSPNYPPHENAEGFINLVTIHDLTPEQREWVEVPYVPNLPGARRSHGVPKWQWLPNTPEHIKKAGHYASNSK